MKLHLIYEGISFNKETEELAFDFQNDSPQDLMKFFEGAPVKKLSDDLFAGFVFENMSADMASHERESNAVALAKALRSFRQQYGNIVAKYSEDSIRGKRISDPRGLQRELEAFSPYRVLKRMLGDEVDTAIQNNAALPASVFTGIFKLVDEKYDVELVRQYVQGKIRLPNRRGTAAGTQAADLKSAYTAAKRRIMTALNRGTGGDQDVEQFVFFAAERLIGFNDFGFELDAIIQPTTNSRLLNDFADLVADGKNIPAIPAVAKSKADVTYTDGGKTIVLVDKNGQVNPALAKLKDPVGKFTTLQDVAEKIADPNRNFKITSLYPDNRNKLSGLFNVAPDFAAWTQQQNAAGKQPNVLLVDDSIFSGTTQREMMQSLNQLQIGKIASYAIVKA